MVLNLIKIPYLKLKYKFLPNEAQGFWVQELLEGHGLGAKIGQILGQGKATRLPKSSLTPLEVKKLFEEHFHKKIEVSDEVQAASIGQVFFITMDTKIYALKLLHPGIKKKLIKEIENILVLGKYFSKVKGFKFDKTIFRRFLNETFEEETDLKREADFQKKFISIFKNMPHFKIPAVESRFSNESFLCQELVHSTLARDLSAFSHFHIFDFYFDSLLTHGLLHGDLNDRNWGIDQNGNTVIYDYGCTQIVSERRREGLRKLILGIDVVNAFEQFGVRLERTSFKGKEQALRDALFIPLFHNTISSEFSLTAFAHSKFGDSIKELREYTDPWVLLMMRSLFSLIRVYQNRKADIPIKTIIEPYLKAEIMHKKATNIKIEVLEGVKQVIYMELPMTALENLEGLMPENVAIKIKEEKINLPLILGKVVESDYSPQELFYLKLEHRTYRVWIE